MSFTSFFTLLVISIVVSAVLHFILKMYIRPGLDSFLSKVIIGYIGAWQGPAVFGDWSVEVGGIDLIPAILGSLALLILLIDMVKTSKAATGK
jgi:uncharacterized membrane protein YeaQ/YmgE (transglycosylase-associated protein family)